MSEYSDIVSFAVALAINLLLFGVLVVSGVTVAFRLAETVSPRLRYSVAVAAFLLAAIVPLVITLSGVFNHNSISTATFGLKQMNELKTGFQGETIKSEVPPQGNTANVAAKKAQSETLDDFVFYAVGSQWAKVFSVLWLFVSASLFFRELLGHFRLIQMRRRLRPASSSLQRELCCPDDIRLYVGEFSSPVTVGLFRPVVIFPARFPDDVSHSAARRILLHEVAHARWLDPLVSALLRIVRAAFWMSPALWFLERIVRAEREVAADCAAVTDFSDSASADNAAEYAASLVKFAEFSRRTARQQRFTASAATHFGNSSCLENRIRRLFAGYGKPVSVARLSLATFVILSSLFGLSLLPIASQQLYPNQQIPDENKTDDISQTNDFNFIEQNSLVDFEKRIERDEDKKTDANQVADRRIKSGKMDAALESPNNILTTSTPLVDTERRTNEVRQENKKNKSNRNVILPERTRATVKPSEAVKPVIKPVVIPTITVKPLVAVKP